MHKKLAFNNENNIYKLAQSLKKEAVERKNLKQLSRDIESARSVYQTAKLQLEEAEREAEALQTRISGLKQRKNLAFSQYSKLNQASQHMQLSGANEVRFRGNSDISYVKDKKEYRLEVDDMGDIKLLPYRTRKKKEELDTNDVMDEGMEVSPEFLS